MKKPAPVRIAICVPSRGTVPIGFATDLAELVMFTTTTLVNDGVLDLGIIVGENTYITKNRQDLAEQALRDGATHLLWLDDDMRFPQDTLLRLFSRGKDIVGVNYVTRRMPTIPITIQTTGLEEGTIKKRLFPSEEDPALVPVDAVGFGAVLIRAPVFNTIGPRPWFEQYFSREHDCWIGEDVHFCMLARAAGHTVWVDTELSTEIAHCGAFEYRLDHAIAWREEGLSDGTE